MLEKQYTQSVLNAGSQFVTLTYRDEEVPLCWSMDRTTPLPTLLPRDLQLFTKRLRKVFAPVNLRLFAVGEYGPKTFRPHYHFGVFNFPSCERGRTLEDVYTKRRLWAQCCDTCRVVGNTWGKGDIEVRDLGNEKCEYLARYVTKKMTKAEDSRLDGRFPEFSRPSRRPGIGVPAVRFMADAIRAHVDPRSLTDVPLGPAGKKMQENMGRLLRGKLRDELGIEKVAESVRQERWAETVLPMFNVMRDQGLNSLKEAFAFVNAPYAEQLKVRMGIWEQGQL